MCNESFNQCCSKECCESKCCDSKCSKKCCKVCFLITTVVISFFVSLLTVKFFAPCVVKHAMMKEFVSKQMDMALMKSMIMDEILTKKIDRSMAKHLGGHEGPKGPKVNK